MTKLLIAGIDPGTTIGIAALDLSGKKVFLSSGKNQNLDSIVKELSKHGKPVAVSTDKAKTPSLVSGIATKFGARIIGPEKDVSVVEKRALAGGQDYSNDHEMDALAAARFAHKKLAPLLGRIKRFAQSENKPELFEPITELVVKKEISIKSAFALLTKPETPESEVIKKVAEKQQIREGAYWKLFDELTTSKETIALLKRQNKKLFNRAQKLQGKLREKKQNTSQPLTDALAPLKSELKRLKQELEKLNHEKKRFENVLASLGKIVVAKKMPNLGWHAYQELVRTLGIRQGDVLFVKDASAVSEKAMKEIAKLAELILYSKPPSNQEQDVTFVPAAGLVKEDLGRFVIVDKEKLVSARQKKSLLREIIKSYQANRSTQ